MKTLNKRQLAFLLEITNGDARAKMCMAWCNSKGIENKATWTASGLAIENDEDYPDDIHIELLAKELNIPNLQDMVDDVENNYLTRAATKKFILYDFPQKHVELCTKNGKIKRLNIPPGLRSMLPSKTIDIIKKKWHESFPKYA
jgi:hypothetical protein